MRTYTINFEICTFQIIGVGVAEEEAEKRMAGSTCPSTACSEPALLTYNAHWSE